MNIQLFAVIFLVIILLVVINFLRKDVINIKYAIVWIIPLSVLLLITLSPSFFDFLVNISGFQLGSNMIFTMLICLLIVITISLTIIVSKQKNMIRILVQEVSLLKEEVKKNKK